MAATRAVLKEELKAETMGAEKVEMLVGEKVESTVNE